MTDANSVYTIREINLESCSFTSPEKFIGFHKSFVNMNGSRGFIIQTPKLVLRDSTDSSFDLLISRNKDRHKEFYNIISHLEDAAILQIVQNSATWFGKKISKDQVETMFRSSIHRPLEINDPFIFKVNKIPNLEIEQNYPVVCLIKIDGIIFGRNSSTLDMKVLQVKVIKTEKIPSEDGALRQEVSQQPEKPFYNDNVSVAPSNYMPMQSNNTQSNTHSNIPSIIEETSEVERVLDDNEKIISLVPEPVSDHVPEPELDHVPDHMPESVPSKDLSMETLKCALMKAVVEGDFERVRELNDLLRGLNN